MAKSIVYLTVIISAVVVFWTALTFFVQYYGAHVSETIGDSQTSIRSLIVFNKDPFTNFDYEIARSVAKGLASSGVVSDIRSVTDVANVDSYNLIVIIANTYNWAPDWPTQKFIKNYSEVLSEKNVLAFTLGAGSTDQSKYVLETLLKKSGITLFESRALWLLRPNDDRRIKDDNRVVANEIAWGIGVKAGRQLAK